MNMFMLCKLVDILKQNTYHLFLCDLICNVLMVCCVKLCISYDDYMTAATSICLQFSGHSKHFFHGVSIVLYNQICFK